MKNMDNRLFDNKQWVRLREIEASKKRLEDDKKELLSACANCEDFRKVVAQKDGWCTKCEIFKALTYINDEIAKL